MAILVSILSLQIAMQVKEYFFQW